MQPYSRIFVGRHLIKSFSYLLFIYKQ
uniref:Uncharacterized protein n=1 Tax=Anguilla anguilla TaxID=7936 RepID=A0A0E9UNF6_ANGAN